MDEGGEQHVPAVTFVKGDPVWRNKGCLAAILLALLGVGGCAAIIAMDDPAPRPPAPRSSEADASARLACSHWANVFADARDGLLTDAELRDKVRQVHEDARVSTAPGVPGGARAMLAAVTAGDQVAFFTAAESFAGACMDVKALR